ncbi:MAG: TlpA family protein disulfide reductase [Acidobacteria bacterium]|nr:TlpA family protein disulfide reductase [Acidobacteriota bacterium]
MKKIAIVAVVLIAVGVLVVLGLRDIRHFGSSPSPGLPFSSATPADSATNGGSGDGALIKFVKNPLPVPAFKLKDLDGNTISSSDWRGKVVLLNFWATWCPPCREEIPDLIRLQQKYQGKLQIIGLSDDTGPVEHVKSFVREAKINYPVAIASPELQAKFGGIMGLPTSFVVDTEGKVVQKHIGLRSPALYDMEIRALLNLPVNAKVETFTDNGQVFLPNATNATELPGVDFSRLTPQQKKAALRQLNESKCTCSCGLTLAQCRINDSTCEMSARLAGQLVSTMASKNRPDENP